MKSLPIVIAVLAPLTLWSTAQDPPPASPPAPANLTTPPEPPSPDELAARQVGIETAWTNALNTAHQISASQGYRRRDAFWTAPLPDEGFTIVPLQLYSSNDYYIILGTDADAASVSIAAFDPDRKLIKSTPDQSDGKLVLKITPEKSGVHYLRLHQPVPPQKTTHCALTYIYK